MNSLGERISACRVRAGLTQKDLGEQLNVTAQAISKWENGQSEPDIESIKRMCQIFNVSVDEIIGTSQTAKEVAPVTAAQESAAIICEEPVQLCEQNPKPSHEDEHALEQGLAAPPVVYCEECNNQKAEKKHMFITVKLLMAAFSILLAVAWLLIGIILVVPILSLFGFPFAQVKRIRKEKQPKNEAAVN